jgi:hypothetical protein
VLTSSRVTWFVIAFMFALPSMLLLFRDSGGFTREVVGRSAIFAVAMAVMAAVVFGKGRQ